MDRFTQDRLRATYGVSLNESRDYGYTERDDQEQEGFDRSYDKQKEKNKQKRTTQTRDRSAEDHRSDDSSKGGNMAKTSGTSRQEGEKTKPVTDSKKKTSKERRAGKNDKAARQANESQLDVVRGIIEAAETALGDAKEALDMLEGQPRWSDHFDNDKEANSGAGANDDASWRTTKDRSKMTPEERAKDKKASEAAVAKFLAAKKAKAANK